MPEYQAVVVDNEIAAREALRQLSECEWERSLIEAAIKTRKQKMEEEFAAQLAAFSDGVRSRVRVFVDGAETPIDQHIAGLRTTLEAYALQMPCKLLSCDYGEITVKDLPDLIDTAEHATTKEREASRSELAAKWLSRKAVALAAWLTEHTLSPFIRVKFEIDMNSINAAWKKGLLSKAALRKFGLKVFSGRQSVSIKTGGEG